MRSFRLSLPRLVGRLAIAVLIGLLAASGCGGASTPADKVGPSVSGAWIRVPAGPGQPAAGYLVIDNVTDTSDVLLGVTTPVAVTCELHESTMDSAGMMGMHPVGQLEVPAHGSVRLEPGGYHLMLTDVEALAVGSKVELHLKFQRAGEITVQAEVRNG